MSSTWRTSGILLYSSVRAKSMPFFIALCQQTALCKDAHDKKHQSPQTAFHSGRQLRASHRTDNNTDGSGFALLQAKAQAKEQTG